MPILRAPANLVVSITDQNDAPVPNAGALEFFTDAGVYKTTYPIDGNAQAKIYTNPGTYRLRMKPKTNYSLHSSEPDALLWTPSARRQVVVTGALTEVTIKLQAARWYDQLVYATNTDFRKGLDVGSGSGGWGTGFNPTVNQLGQNIDNITNGGGVTLVVGQTHSQLVGDEVTISGCSNPDFNGRWRITNIGSSAPSCGSGPAPTLSFTINQTSPSPGTGGKYVPHNHELILGAGSAGGNAIRYAWPERLTTPNIFAVDCSNGFNMKMLLQGPIGAGSTNWFIKWRVKFEAANGGRGTSDWSANKPGGGAAAPEQKFFLASMGGVSAAWNYLIQDYAVGSHRMAYIVNDGIGPPNQLECNLAPSPNCEVIVEDFNWHTFGLSQTGLNTGACEVKSYFDDEEHVLGTYNANNMNNTQMALASFFANKNTGNNRMSCLVEDQGIYTTVPDFGRGVAGSGA